MDQDPSDPGATAPDLDLCAYVIASAPSVAALRPVAVAVGDLVGSGHLLVLDVAVLERPAGATTVRTHEPGDLPALATALAPVLDATTTATRTVGFSQHDLELAGLTLAPGTAALLLLWEDRWASALSSALRGAGGRVAGGERIGRDRLRAHLDRGGAARVGGLDDVGRAARPDLLAREPSAGGPPGRQLIDRTDQIRTLADLVDDGVLSLEQYDAQRRVIIGE